MGCYLDLNGVREYVHKTVRSMGNYFSHFTIEIWTTGRSNEDGSGTETHYILMLVPHPNVSPSEWMSMLKTMGYHMWCTPMEVSRFAMYIGFNYTPGDAFRNAQRLGRKLYYELRKECPIHRKLGYND